MIPPSVNCQPPTLTETPFVAPQPSKAGIGFGPTYERHQSDPTGPKAWRSWGYDKNNIEPPRPTAESRSCMCRFSTRSPSHLPQLSCSEKRAAERLYTLEKTVYYVTRFTLTPDGITLFSVLSSVKIQETRAVVCVRDTSSVLSKIISTRQKKSLTNSHHILDARCRG